MSAVWRTCRAIRGLLSEVNCSVSRPLSVVRCKSNKATDWVGINEEADRFRRPTITGSILVTDTDVTADEEDLFSDPIFFQTPVLMLHASYSDFAVSYHAPDKLNELDALWTCFPSDIRVYGMAQRTQDKTVKMLLNRAYKMLQKSNVDQCRVVFKGYNRRSLLTATTYMDRSFYGIDFISVTDLTRKHGEESPVYHRPLPRYPMYRRPQYSYMLDGPKWAPKTEVDKFRKLNVLYMDKPAPGAGITVKPTETKVGRYGFVLGKGAVKKAKQTSGALQDLNSVLDTK